MNPKQITELMSFYFDKEQQVEIQPVPFGLTHQTLKVRVGGQAYIARIYNRHSKTEQQLAAEIKLITHLDKQRLRFQLPVYLKTKAGDSYVKFPDGQLAALIPFIEGKVPTLRHSGQIVEYGRTVGELSAALAIFPDQWELPDLWFHRLDQVHPLSGSQTVKDFLKQPPFQIDPGVISSIRKTIIWIDAHTDLIERLPRQMVHHDLLVFNLLIHPDTNRMTGVLDFDYASYDTRALELAICINHLLQQESFVFEHLSCFLKAYSESMKLTKEEIERIPDLMLVYHVSLLAIYVGQHHGGQNISEYFNYIANQLIVRKEWLQEHEQDLLRELKQTVLLA